MTPSCILSFFSRRHLPTRHRPSSRTGSFPILLPEHAIADSHCITFNPTSLPKKLLTHHPFSFRVSVFPFLPTRIFLSPPSSTNSHTLAPYSCVSPSSPHRRLSTLLSLTRRALFPPPPALRLLLCSSLILAPASFVVLHHLSTSFVVLAYSSHHSYAALDRLALALSSPRCARLALAHVSDWYWCSSTRKCRPNHPRSPEPDCDNWSESNQCCMHHPTPSQGSHHKKRDEQRRLAISDANDEVAERNAFYCPAPMTACPVVASASNATASSLSTSPEWSYECIDTQAELESCGGCLSEGQGQDCTAIAGAKNVGCGAGRCEVYSCLTGWKIGEDKASCVRA